jgi:hypothetical protein
MTQISRPFQIALVAVVLIAAVWFVALRGHSSASSNESSAPAPAASSASSSASSASTGSAASQSASSSSGGSSSSQGSGTYHGAAPGVDGLTRAIAKARGAVTESERHAKALQQKSAQASGEAQTPSSSASASAHHAATTGGRASKHGTTKTHSSSSAASTKSAASKAASNAATGKPTIATTTSGIPVLQARVERELKQGKVAALLFWNPKGTVDKAVRRELQAAGGKLHGKLAISVARSSEVGLFGSFTRSVQVYGTPTILLVNHAGKTASVTGLTDVFSIEQAVKEVKRAK